MPIFTKFTELMKSEPARMRKKQNVWVIDESKCLGIEEVKKIRSFCNKAKLIGLKNRKFTPVRNWFMTQLALNAGLRVQEMADLKHGGLFIDGNKASIVVIGKGNKKRVVWINSDFKKNCKIYIGYKKRFGYSTDEESYLLNNLKGNKISKRALQKFFKIILEKTNLPIRYYIHCLRHTYATFVLKATNNDYKFLKEQLGHASIKTTQIYAGIVEIERREDIEKLYK